MFNKYICDVPTKTFMKNCTKCLMLKPESEFYRSKNSLSGFLSYCKDCDLQRKKTPKAQADRKSRYHKNKESILSSNNKYREKNRSKILVRMKNYYSEKKDSGKWLQSGWRNKGIMYKTGIPFTLEHFSLELQKCASKCSICDSDGSDHKKGLVVDHDHGTGLFRGILCAKCNTGLSCFKESGRLLSSASNYLANF